MRDDFTPEAQPETDSAEPATAGTTDGPTASASETPTAVAEQPEAAPTVTTQPAPAAAPNAPRSTVYAVIETGGKQYRVRVGDRIRVEKLTTPAGDDLTIDRVLLVGNDGDVRIGAPVVEGASVVARVEDHMRGEKIVVFKYKAKKGYRRRMGHRQSLTQLTITAINA